MSYPRKVGRRVDAFRSIKIGDCIFRWRFRPGPKESVLILHGPVSSGRPLSVIMAGWRDPWLNLSGFHIYDSGGLVLETKTRNEPETVTPKFAQSAILHALAKGWNPLERGPRLFCIYGSGQFSELSAQRETLTVTDDR